MTDHTAKQQAEKRITAAWMTVGVRFLPFADAAEGSVGLPRLLRLSLFQVSVGMAMVLLNATLNRVMIVELHVASSIVAFMIALPVLFAPFRVLIGHQSDHHRSFLGWRRLPYMWFGTLLQYGGLAMMPFALLVLTGDANGPVWVGEAAAALSFLMVGAGLHTTQTSGLALAADITAEEKRPRMIAFMYVILLIGMGIAALVLGALLSDFSEVRLIQVIQGCAVATMLINMVALWKQEGRGARAKKPGTDRPSLALSWQQFSRRGTPTRLLVAVALGSAAFAMQEVLLEPYGGEILGLSVASTTMLTALLAGGTIAGFMLAGYALTHGYGSCFIAAMGGLVGLLAFPAVIFSDAISSVALFQGGSVLIGFGTGLFLIGTLTAAMDLAQDGESGMAMGTWGAAYATATGVAIALGGVIRDWIGTAAMRGQLGSALFDRATGYVAVYLIEILFIFLMLIAIGPLVRHGRIPRRAPRQSIGLAEYPG